MTIWEFASEPPEPTEARSCPEGALDSEQGKALVSRLSKDDEAILGKPPSEYLEEVRSCTCPEPFKDMLNIDMALSLEICRFSYEARGARIARQDEWVASEREAHAAMKGSVR
ncbi:MAG: hypothetical protein AAGJ85_02690 [Pseudomonadota bacterium]